MTLLNIGTPRYSFGRWCVHFWKEQQWPSTIRLQNALAWQPRWDIHPILYHHILTNTNTRRNVVDEIISWEEMMLEEARLIPGLNPEEDFHFGCNWLLAGQPGEKAGHCSGIGGLRKSPRGWTWCSWCWSLSTELQQQFRLGPWSKLLVILAMSLAL